MARTEDGKDDGDDSDECSEEEEEEEKEEESEKELGPPLSPSKSITKQKKFIVFESNLLELMKYCIKCGAIINSSLTKQIKNTGSQLTLEFHCSKGTKIPVQSPKIALVQSSNLFRLTLSKYMPT